MRGWCKAIHLSVWVAGVGELVAAHLCRAEPRANGVLAPVWQATGQDTVLAVIIAVQPHKDTPGTLPGNKRPAPKSRTKKLPSGRRGANIGEI